MTKKSKWTQFMDMHSGGGTKVNNYDYIYIEAPESEALEYFKIQFERNPNNVSCDCCGSDYSITESDSLEKATKYERGWDRPRESLQKYLRRENILVVYAKQLKQEKTI